MIYEESRSASSAPAGADTVRRKSYVWGLDLGGTLHGVHPTGSGTDAGGIQGLLAVVDVTGSKTYLPCDDGHGNITALIEGESGTEAARFEYGPFGESLRVTYRTPAVRTSLGESGFRFSTKYTDGETGLVYYGYRYYNPETGRWLNRDPIGERGGVNLFGMVGNDTLNGLDCLGLERFFTISAVRDNTISTENAFRFLKSQVDGFREVISKCCKEYIMFCDVKVRVIYNPYFDRIIWPSGNEPFSSVQQMPFGLWSSPSNMIPILLTTRKIGVHNLLGIHSGASDGSGLSGVIIRDGGNYPDVLAHEIGHVIKWKDSDYNPIGSGVNGRISLPDIHSRDPSHLMSEFASTGSIRNIYCQYDQTKTQATY